MKKNVGFSLVELIVVMSIIATLIGLATISLANTQQRASLNNSVQVFISDIRQQQIKAMVGDTQEGATSDSYGIHTDSNKYVLFKGTSYDPVASSNFIVDLSSNIQFLFPGSDIIFYKVSGRLRTGGLVGYWDFNEGTGQIIRDSSGSGNDGTLGVSSPIASDDPAWTTSKPGLGGALDFDGIDDEVDVPDSNSLDLTSSGTLAAWVKIDALPTITNDDYEIIGKETGFAASQVSYVLFLDQSNSNRVTCGISNLSTPNGIAGDTPPAGSWQHVVCTWDGSKITLYQNAIQTVTATQTVNAGVSSFIVRIGGATGTTLAHFDGVIDEAQIYNRALTAFEVFSLYTNTQFKLQDTTNGNTKTIQINQYGVITSVN